MVYFGVASVLLNLVLGAAFFAGCFCWWKGLLPSPTKKRDTPDQVLEPSTEAADLPSTAPPRHAVVVNEPAVLHVPPSESVDLFRVGGVTHLIPPPPYFEDSPPPMVRPGARTTYWAEDLTPRLGDGGAEANPFSNVFETPPPRYQTRHYEMRSRTARPRPEQSTDQEQEADTRV
jgi:hypothetical protein